MLPSSAFLVASADLGLKSAAVSLKRPLDGLLPLLLVRGVVGTVYADAPRSVAVEPCSEALAVELQTLGVLAMTPFLLLPLFVAFEHEV